MSQKVRLTVDMMLSKIGDSNISMTRDKAPGRLMLTQQQLEQCRLSTPILTDNRDSTLRIARNIKILKNYKFYNFGLARCLTGLTSKMVRLSGEYLKSALSICMRVPVICSSSDGLKWK